MRKALLALALLVSMAFPTITSLIITGAIDSSGTADMEIVADFQYSEGQTACVNISAPLDYVTVRDRSGLVLEREVKSYGNSTQICASVPSDYLEYDITSSSFTAKTGPLWEYDLAIGASMDVGFLNASLSLPAGATLKATNGAVQSGGDSLVVSWSALDIDTLHRARMKASYELSQPPPGPDFALFAAAGILAFIAAFFAFKRLRKPGGGTRAAPENRPSAVRALPVMPAVPAPLESSAVFRTLDETDKEIIREIRRQGGKTTQAHLNLHTHMPKATLSRRLASLENRGILKKTQKGNRNLISLGDMFGS